MFFPSIRWLFYARRVFRAERRCLPSVALAEVKCVVAEDGGWISKSITKLKAQDEAAFGPEFKFTQAPPQVPPPPPPQPQQSPNTGKRAREEEETLTARRVRLRLPTGAAAHNFSPCKRIHDEPSDSQDGTCVGLYLPSDVAWIPRTTASAFSAGLLGSFSCYRPGSASAGFG
jgi:hypothetical protein